MINLWEENIPGFEVEYEQKAPNITPYIIDTKKKHGAVIVCPGGGYYMKADHEGEPIALWLNTIGISAFVLDYRVYPYHHPYPMFDVLRAIRFVRFHAEKWNIDPDKIGILGFSAGGHLASTAGTHFDGGNLNAEDPIEKISSKPNAMILCYPVITFGDYRHDGSKVALIGENPTEELRDSLSNELKVTYDTPPTLLWHTANDDVVPVENSLFFAKALSSKRVPFELHVFPDGPHGVGLAQDNPVLGQWPKLCEKWLQELSFSAKK